MKKNYTIINAGENEELGLTKSSIAKDEDNKYIKHPNEVLSVGDIVDCYVSDINNDKKKVSLSLIEGK